MNDKYICRSCGQALDKDSPLERALAWVKQRIKEVDQEIEAEGKPDEVRSND